MSGVYSSKLARGISTSGGAVTVFTVGAGTTVVIRSVQLFQYAGAAAAFDVVTGDGVSIVHADSSAVPSYSNSDLRAVLTFGDIIDIENGGGDWTYAISGYVLTD